MARCDGADMKMLKNSHVEPLAPASSVAVPPALSPDREAIWILVGPSPSIVTRLLLPPRGT